MYSTTTTTQINYNKFNYTQENIFKNKNRLNKHLHLLITQKRQQIK